MEVLIVRKAPCFLWVMLWEEPWMVPSPALQHLQALGEEGAPRKAPGLYSGAQMRGVLLSRAEACFLSACCTGLLLQNFPAAPESLSLSFMLHPKCWSLLCKPQLCMPAEGQGLTQVVAGWGFSSFWRWNSGFEHARQVFCHRA